MAGFDGHKRVTRLDGNSKGSWYEYTCGHCDAKVSGAVLATTNWDVSSGRDTVTHIERWIQCTNCGHGSVICGDNTIPGLPFGPQLEGLPADLNKAYQEARNCMGVAAFTAAELICRKILMHVAVEKGGDEGKSFASYLTYLENEGYVTPPMKSWVDLIRQHGNQSTHQLEAADKDRAESTVMLTAELLRLVYEMDYYSRKFTANNDDTSEPKVD